MTGVQTCALPMYSVVWKAETGEMRIRHDSIPPMPEGLRDLLDASDLTEEE